MRVTITIRDKIYLSKSQLSKSTLTHLKKAFTYKDPQFAKLTKMGYKPWFQGLSPKMQTFYETSDEFIVWRGALKTLVSYFKRSEMPYRLQDDRLWHEKISLPHKIELRDYQVKPARLLIKRQQTLLRAPCGFGKTEVLLYCAAHFKRPTLVLVWQERQQKVWVERVEKWFGFVPGGIGGSYKKHKLKRITIGLLQSVRNRLENLRDKFSVVIADEVQRYGAETFREVINEFPAAIRLGASDDERRKDRREFLIYDTFGQRGYDAGEDEGQVPVDIYAVPTAFNPDIPTDNWAKLITELTSDRHRNNLIVDIASGEVECENRVIIFSDRVDHCYELKHELVNKGYRAGLLLGGAEHKEEADETQKGLTDGSIEIGIGTSVAEQSINIPPLNVGIMTCCSADYDLFRFKQMRGRIARPDEGKERARLYYIWDKHIFSLKRKLRNIKRRYSYKELKRMSSPKIKAVPTTDSLKRGCEELGIEIPAKTTAKKLEKLITRELAKDPTYGGYSCGACFRDIVKDGLTVCPFCAMTFVPFADDAEEKKKQAKQAEAEIDDEEETAEEDEEEEETAEEDEEEEETAEEDEEEDTDDDEEDEEEEAVSDDEDEEEEEEVTDDDEEEEEEATTDDEDEEEDEGDMGLEFVDDDEEEEEKPVKRKKMPKSKSKSAVKKSRNAVNRVRTKYEDTKTAAKRKDLAEKHKVIAAGLPYAEEQLKRMKRSALMMVMSSLKIKNPIKMAKTGNMVKVIMEAQKKKFGTSGKAGKKLSKKVSTTKKKVAKKKKSSKK